MTDKEIESLYELLCHTETISLALTIIEGSNDTFNEVLWKIWKKYNKRGRVSYLRELSIGDIVIEHSTVSNHVFKWDILVNQISTIDYDLISQSCSFDGMTSELETILKYGEIR